MKIKSIIPLLGLIMSLVSYAQAKEVKYKQQQKDVAVWRVDSGATLDQYHHNDLKCLCERLVYRPKSTQISSYKKTYDAKTQTSTIRVEIVVEKEKVFLTLTRSPKEVSLYVRQGQTTYIDMGLDANVNLIVVRGQKKMPSQREDEGFHELILELLQKYDYK